MLESNQPMEVLNVNAFITGERIGDGENLNVGAMTWYPMQVQVQEI